MTQPGSPTRPFYRRWTGLALAFVLVVLATVVLALVNVHHLATPSLSTPSPSVESTRTITPSVVLTGEGTPSATSPEGVVGELEAHYGSFEPVTVGDHGDQLIVLPAASGVVVASAPLCSSLVITVLDGRGLPTGDLLVNADGPYQGTTVYGLDSVPGRVLQIRADGPWELTILPVAALPQVEELGTGQGDSAVIYLGPRADLLVSHPDEGLMVVRDLGVADSVLLYQVVPGEDRITMSAGPHLVTIRADGGWGFAAS